MAYLNMDLSDTPSGMGYDPIAAGEYQAQIIETEISRSQSENLMLNLTWQIQDGECAGRMVFDRLMLEGSDKAVAFGKVKLKTMADAVGHPNPNRIEHTEALHGLPCLITVTIKEYNGENRNEVKNYRSLKEAGPANKAAAPPAAAPPKKGPTPPPPKKQQSSSPFDPPAEEAQA